MIKQEKRSTYNVFSEKKSHLKIEKKIYLAFGSSRSKIQALNYGNIKTSTGIQRNIVNFG